MAQGLAARPGVFLGSVAIVSAAALLVRSLAKADDVERILDAFRSFGIPTTRDEWRNADSVVGLASLGGMLLGSVLGGVLGERWFTKVSRSAVEAEVDLRERMGPWDERLAPVAAGHVARTENGTARDNDVRDNDVRDNDVRDNDVRVETDVDGLTKDELYHRAQERDIPGRSQMTKDQLRDALQQR